MKPLIVAALTLLLTATPAHAGRLHPDDTQPATAHVDVPERPTVRVSRGQSLSLIADQHDVPGGWRRLAWINRDEVMPDPDLIEVGTRLVLPIRDGKKIAWTTTPAAPPSSSSSSSGSSSSTTSPSPTSGDVWWRLALCESGGRQHAHSPSGTYHSYFQWSLATWHSLGMSGDPHNYSYSVQLAAAKRLQARSGWGQWPACSAKLGLR